MPLPEDPFGAIGGAEALRALVDRFYDVMDTLPEARAIRQMHPADLSESRDKLYEFLSGWMGGPPLYLQKRGHPRLRARHMPFAIATEEARQWLLCMSLALDEQVEDPRVRDQLLHAFGQMAAHMRNRPDAP